MNRHKSVEFFAEASEDVRAAYCWYEERSPRAAAAFSIRMNEAIEKIAASPATWPSYHHGTRRYLLHGYPYLVIYRDTPESIDIVAVAHVKRKPGFWRDRLTH